MMKRTLTITAAVLALVGLLVATGCTRVPLSGTGSGSGSVSVSRDETVTVPLDGAATLSANVRMGVGELTLSGEPSSTAALDARFRYAPVRWKPTVEYSKNASEGMLYVSQPEGDTKMNLGPDIENTWDLTLPGKVPVKLSLKLGLGKSTVDLRDVDVRDLEVVTGVGETTLDLSGARTDDVDARVTSGVGELVIRVPKGVGVRITGGNQMVGELIANGFTKQGDTRMNAAYGSAGPKIEIAVTGGIGEIRIEEVQ